MAVLKLWPCTTDGPTLCRGNTAYTTTCAALDFPAGGLTHSVPPSRGGGTRGLTPYGPRAPQMCANCHLNSVEPQEDGSRPFKCFIHIHITLDYKLVPVLLPAASKAHKVSVQPSTRKCLVES